MSIVAHGDCPNVLLTTILLDKTGGVAYLGGLPTLQPGQTVVHGEPIGRLIIKKDLTIYKADKNGNLVASRHVKSGTIPYYGIEGDFYNIGQNQYIQHQEGKVIPYNGCIIVRKSTTVYSPNRKKYSTLKAGDKVKVYGQDVQKYQVGNGNYVKKG